MKPVRNHSWVLKLLVSVAVLVALWFVIDVAVIREALANATLGGVLVVLGLIPLSMGLRAIRFWLLLGRSLSLWSCVRITLVGETLNIVLPASTGDVAKAYYGVREHGRKEEVVTATLLDKASGLLGLLLLGAVAALLHGYVLLGMGFSVAALFGLVFYLIPGAIPWKLLSRVFRRFSRSLDVSRVQVAFSQYPRKKLLALAISLVAWIVSFVHVYAITRLFGLSLEPLFLASVAPLINLSRLFPFAFAGLGVQEGVTASLFSLAGISASVAVAVSLVFTLCTTVIPGLFGLYFILRMKK